MNNIITNRISCVKKLFLNISQYSQANNCDGFLFLIKLQAWRPVTLLKIYFNAGVFLLILQNFWEHLLLLEQKISKNLWFIYQYFIGTYQWSKHLFLKNAKYFAAHFSRTFAFLYIYSKAVGKTIKKTLSKAFIKYYERFYSFPRMWKPSIV